MILVPLGRVSLASLTTKAGASERAALRVSLRIDGKVGCRAGEVGPGHVERPGGWAHADPRTGLIQIGEPVALEKLPQFGFAARSVGLPAVYWLLLKV